MGSEDERYSNWGGEGSNALVAADVPTENKKVRLSSLCSQLRELRPYWHPSVNLCVPLPRGDHRRRNSALRWALEAYSRGTAVCIFCFTRDGDDSIGSIRGVPWSRSWHIFIYFADVGVWSEQVGFIASCDCCHPPTATCMYAHDISS